MLNHKFEVDNVPDGLIYFPMAFGGLRLRNPFISLQAMRSSVIEDPNIIIDEAFEAEAQEYRLAKSRFEKSNSQCWNFSLGECPTEFMGWKECTRHQRARSKPFLGTWNELQMPAQEDASKLTLKVERLLKKLPVAEGVDGAGSGEGIVSDWDAMTQYWKEIVSFYAEEMEGKFGGLAVVEKALLPMGLVGLWKGRKGRWEGLGIRAGQEGVD